MRRRTEDDGRSVGQPTSFFGIRLSSVLALTVGLATFACLAVAALAAPRVNLVHLAYYNSCTIRTYAYHWQNPERQPETLRYDFVNSPDSLVVVAVWLADGPAWNLSQSIPSVCPA